jgi:hypothetical protein
MQEDETPTLTPEEITRLYEKKTQEILFAFTDEMIALEQEITEAKQLEGQQPQRNQ